MFLKSAAMLAKKLLDNDKLQLGDKQICLPNVIIIVLTANKTIIFAGISLSWTQLLSQVLIRFARGEGGDSAYERGVDAHRKFWIKPLKQTDLGVAQAFSYP